MPNEDGNGINVRNPDVEHHHVDEVDEIQRSMINNVLRVAAAEDMASRLRGLKIYRVIV